MISSYTRMRPIVIFFSQSGNTKKVAFSIYEGVKDFIGRCRLVSIGLVNQEELKNYDLIGIGSPVWGGVPAHVRRFINRAPELSGRYAFSFCTHGAKPERFFPQMARLLTKKGLTLIGMEDWYGSVFHPLLPKPYLTDGHPDEIDLREAYEFGMRIAQMAVKIANGEEVPLPTLPPPPPPRTVKRLYPKLSLIKERCKFPECQLCVYHCRLRVIDLSKNPPKFPRVCQPCYFCEMICPEGAIEINYEEDSAIEIERARTLFIKSLEDAERAGRFRRLVPLHEVGWDTPFYKLYDTHPRIVPEEEIDIGD